MVYLVWNSIGLVALSALGSGRTCLTAVIAIVPMFGVSTVRAPRIGLGRGGGCPAVVGHSNGRLVVGQCPQGASHSRPFLRAYGRPVGPGGRCRPSRAALWVRRRRPDACSHGQQVPGEVRFSTPGGGGLIEPPRTGGGGGAWEKGSIDRTINQLSFSYSELWRRRRQKNSVENGQIFFHQIHGK